MKTFLLISPKNRTVHNFRGDLIRQIQSRGYQVCVTGPDKTDLERVLALGVEFIEIPMNKNGVNPLKDIKYLLALRRVIREKRPCVTLGYTIKPAIYGAIAARLEHVPTVCSMITGVGYLFTSTSLKARVLKLCAKALYRLGLACAGKVIFQNPDDRADFLQARLVRGNKTRVVHGSGVNTSYFAPAPLPEEFTVLTISRALRSKGAGEFLAAARIVHAARKDIRMVFVGAIDESMQDSLREEDVMACAREGAIEYHPETSDVRQYIRECSLFALASYREGTPRTVLESMAMARPIITTDVPGCRETVKEGENGFLVPAGNAGALAGKILQAAALPRERLEEMARASRDYCEEKFDVHKVNDDMCAIMGV